MKHAGWVAAAVMVVVGVGMLEIGRALRGPTWAVAIAGIAITLVALVLVYGVARWADRHIEAERKRRDELSR